MAVGEQASSRRRAASGWTSTLVGAAVLFVVGAGIGVAALRPELLDGPRCFVFGDIKGNVSVETGERIYHVPGQRYYDETVISWTRGERRFCSEAQAREAGWRRSRV